MNGQTSISVGVTLDAVWVRVEGKGNFQNSAPLRDFAKEMLGRGHRRFVIDLRGCPLMDSTFMGTLAGVALKLHAAGDGVVQVVNLNERTRSLLTNLGLDHLLRIEPESGIAGPAPLEEESLSLDPGNKKTQTETMLAAHEAVVEANPENEAKFKDVLEYLRHDLQMGS